MNDSENKVFENGGKKVKIIVSVIVALIIAVSSFFIGFFTHKLTRDEYVSSVEWVMSMIEKNYYFSEDFDKEDAKNLSLKALVSKLDIYSEYYTAEEYRAVMSDNEGEKSGIGITYQFLKDKGVLLVSVMGNSPAWISGLRSGDILTGGIADGEQYPFDTSAAFSDFISAQSPGEKFTVTTEHAEYTLSREVYTASYAYMATADTSWEFVSSGDGKGLALVENRSGAIPYLPDGAAYINLSQFFGTMADEFGVLMSKFNAEHYTTMYLDLRNNGGGYVSAMQDIAGYFTSSLSNKTHVAMTAKYRNGRNEVYDCVKHSGTSLVSKDTKIYVLANSGTASASEALIGVLVSYGFVDYPDIFVSNYSDDYMKFIGVGQKNAQTYGKGIMQSTFYNYYTGEAVKLTTARIYWPNDKCIHDVALSERDGVTLVDADWIVTREDTELQRVVQKTTS